MSSGDAQTKGLGFIRARAFVLARAGETGWEAVLAQIAPVDRTALASIVAAGWYPVALQARLYRAIEDVLGAGNMAFAVEIGRYSAERDLTTMHRVFLRLFRPTFAFEKLAELWSRYHDTGVWTIEAKGPQHIIGRLEAWGGQIDPVLCRSTLGFIARSIELAGARAVVVEHPSCLALGDPACVFRARWGLPRRAHLNRARSPS